MEKQRALLRIGMIGAGYMGKAHTIGYKSAPTVFGLSSDISCEKICTRSMETAEIAARQLGYKEYTDRWQDLVAAPNVDAIVIATPPDSHLPIAEAAAAVGKPVFCEKPLAMDLASARRMCDVVEQAGVPNMVGYNYNKTPASQLVKEMLEAGEIGEIYAFHGRHIEDYMHGPELPNNWRTRLETGGEAGALGDIGSHIIAAALRLIGGIDELICQRRTVISQRQGERVGNDDSGEILLNFTSGASGSISFSRVYAGKKMGYDFEIVGSKGSIAFDQENLNEVHLYQAGDPQSRQGFKRIMTGPSHPDYQAFCLGAGHGNGYNDMMTIQARDFVDTIMTQSGNWADFRFGYEVDRVVEAALAASKHRSWVKVRDFV
eukprot:gene15335-640_t